MSHSPSPPFFSYIGRTSASAPRYRWVNEDGGVRIGSQPSRGAGDAKTTGSDSGAGRVQAANAAGATASAIATEATAAIPRIDPEGATGLGASPPACPAPLVGGDGSSRHRLPR